MTALRFAFAFCAASTLFGQTEIRNFHLTTTPNLPAVQEIASIMRTVGNIQKVTIDVAKFDIMVGGNDADLNLAAWLVKQLDTTTPTPAEYAIPGTSDVVRVFFAAHSSVQSDLNELVTTLRTVADIQRIFTYSPTHAITIRTRAARATLADWLFHQLDVAPDDQSRLESHQIAMPDVAGQFVKVMYLVHPTTQAGLNEVITTIRVMADIRPIFSRSSPQGMAFRGTEAEVQLAEWIVKQLDSTAPAAAKYSIPDTSDEVRVFFAAHTSMPAMLNELLGSLRTVGDIQRIFTYSRTNAIMLRTSAARAPLADWLFHQLDLAPDDKNRWQTREMAMPDAAGQIVKVVYLVHPTTYAGFGEVVSTLRTIADIGPIFTRSSPQGIAFRGTLAQVQLADWLFQQVDAQPDNQMRAEKHEFAAPGTGDVTRVYYLNTADPNATATAVRSQAGIPKIFVCSAPKALSMRGTTDELAIADQVIKQYDGAAPQ